MGSAPEAAQDDDDLSLVQLDWVDVKPELLTGSGRALDEVLVEHQPREGNVDVGVLPRVGWREIERIHTPLRRRTFAAPHHADASGWALLAFSGRDGRWIASGDPGPTSTRPGRAARRRHLRLRWPDTPIIAPAGSIPELVLLLQNVGEEPWVGIDGSDTLAWLTDTAGRRLPAARHWSHAGVSVEQRIEPGECLAIQAAVMTNAVEDLPAGDYGLDALLLDLKLRSNHGALRLT